MSEHRTTPVDPAVVTPPLSSHRVAAVVPTFLASEMHHVYRQVVGLRRYSPQVVTQKRTNADRFPFEQVTVLSRPWLRELRRFWARRIARAPIIAMPGEVRRLNKALRRGGAAVVHFYFGQNGLYWLPWLTQRQLPAVVSFHGADGGVGMTSPIARRYLAKLFDQVELVLVRSDELATAVQALGCPPAIIRIQRTGIPLQDFRFVDRISSFGSTPFPYLVQVCRLIEKKGIDDTLRAFASLRTLYPQARLAIAGSGPLEDKLRTMAEELDIADHVEWHGFLGHEPLKELLSKAHVFVHPSKLTSEGDREGVPNTMLEAMATGLPVVATKHGGIPEALNDGIEGRLVAEHDHEALTQAIVSIIEDPTLYAEISHDAAARVATDFSLEAQCRILEAHYDEAQKCFHARKTCR